uniref:Uncharacterized protein n=1 Tax=Rhizophora mucronata TaxID=61149 RepID=A0A2P2JNX4_RHIMU
MDKYCNEVRSGIQSGKVPN